MQTLIGFAAGIILIGVQTSLIAVLPASMPFYNLLIPYVIFLSLFRPSIEAFPQMLCFGLIMDMISGAPQVIYLIIFIVLFILFHNIRTYFQLLDSNLFVILIAVGVVIEHLVFGLASMIQHVSVKPSFYAFYVVLIHFFWAVATGPLLFVLFKRAFAGMDEYKARRAGKLS